MRGIHVEGRQEVIRGFDTGVDGEGSGAGMARSISYLLIARIGLCARTHTLHARLLFNKDLRYGQAAPLHQIRNLAPK